MCLACQPVEGFPAREINSIVVCPCDRQSGWSFGDPYPLYLLPAGVKNKDVAIGYPYVALGVGYSAEFAFLGKKVQVGEVPLAVDFAFYGALVVFIYREQGLS